MAPRDYNPVARPVGAANSVARASDLRQAELHDVGAAGAEAGLAVAQVEAPELVETLVEAERPDLVPCRLEPLSPPLQRLGVVLAEAVTPVQARPARSVTAFSRCSLGSMPPGKMYFWMKSARLR